MTMLTAGIVAEYNPFHNGHKYMIEQVRSNGATHVVAVMSGAVVQRGDISVFDKHFRSKKAVENGVDLVLELPFPYSCSSAETFAWSAVSIFAGLGDNVVNKIAFGCENDDILLLKKSADASEILKESSIVRDKLSQGLSYPATVCQTASELFGDEVGSVLKSPNNTLAVEYIKSAEKLMPEVGFMPVKRQYAKHDSNQTEHGITSASHIRGLLNQNENAEEFCPYSVENVPTFSLEKSEREVLFRLGCSEKSELEQIADCSLELADKIIKATAECPKNLDEFFTLVKSRNVTMARLRRIVMHLVLGAKKCDFVPPPYARVLAFNKRGAEILSKCGGKLPVDTSLKALENYSDHAKRIIRLENNGVRFQNACAMGEYKPYNEYRKQVRIIL